MPTTPKSNRRGAVQEPEKNRRNRSLTEKASSFHGRIHGGEEEMAVAGQRIRRPHTLPDLFGGRSLSAAGGGFADAGAGAAAARPTKLLFNVTVQGSVGAVQVLASPESTVGELIAAALRQYSKEGRRPFVESDPGRFGLHYSQFSLESLEKEEKLVALGSRNFFLCLKREMKVEGGEGINGGGMKATSSSCSKEADKDNKNGAFAWLKFMDFLK